MGTARDRDNAGVEVKMINSLNPGSDEAIKNGCTCPVLDNEHGNHKRVPHDKNGNPLFWISGDCPIHNPQTTKAKKEKK